MSKPEPFKITLSHAQSQEALQCFNDAIENLRLHWQRQGLSEDQIQQKTTHTLEIARIFVYGCECISKIHTLLEKKWGAFFAQWTDKIDQGLNSLEGARALTSLLRRVESLLPQPDTTQGAILKLIHPFCSEYRAELEARCSAAERELLLLRQENAAKRARLAALQKQCAQVQPQTQISRPEH